MCNLYSETKGQAAIRGLFRTAHDRTGNLPAFPGIIPDVRRPSQCGGAPVMSMLAPLQTATAGLVFQC